MKKIKILFLEDNIYFAEALLEVFSDYSWEVKHVKNVDHAKNFFDEINFDLVISDLHLHDQENQSFRSGLDLIHHIRSRKKSKIPIVVTTGLELVSQDQLIGDEVNLFFYKSNFDIRIFISSIQKLLNQDEIA